MEQQEEKNIDDIVNNINTLRKKYNKAYSEYFHNHYSFYENVSKAEKLYTDACKENFEIALSIDIASHICYILRTCIIPENIEDLLSKYKTKWSSATRYIVKYCSVDDIFYYCNKFGNNDYMLVSIFNRFKKDMPENILTLLQKQISKNTPEFIKYILKSDIENDILIAKAKLYMK